MIGAYAKTPRIQGSGSSRVQALQVTDFIDYIDARRKPGDEVPYAPGYSLDGSANDDLAFAALDLASRTKNVLYFMALSFRLGCEATKSELSPWLIWRK